MTRPHPLTGARIAITRPAGTAAALARQVRAWGGEPILLPGSSLRAVADAGAARQALRAALACDVVIFTSPAAVRFARGLARLRTRGEVVAPGAGTRRALQRAGFAKARAPSREDSEGILALRGFQNVRGREIGIVGAAGGRGLLAHGLAARGAAVRHAHVYRRQPARLGRRHAEALLGGRRRPRLYVLLSSAEALGNLLGHLPADARRAMLAGTAIVSSARLAAIAGKAGFARTLRAASARSADMLAVVISDVEPASGTKPGS